MGRFFTGIQITTARYVTSLVIQTPVVLSAVLSPPGQHSEICLYEMLAIRTSKLGMRRMPQVNLTLRIPHRSVLHIMPAD